MVRNVALSGARRSRRRRRPRLAVGADGAVHHAPGVNTTIDVVKLPLVVVVIFVGMASMLVFIVVVMMVVNIAICVVIWRMFITFVMAVVTIVRVALLGAVDAVVWRRRRQDAGVVVIFVQLPEAVLVVVRVDVVIRNTHVPNAQVFQQMLEAFERHQSVYTVFAENAVQVGVVMRVHAAGDVQWR